MSERDDRVYAEAVALWRQLRAEPPPPEADGAMVLDLLLRTQPPPVYERLAHPQLRPANIAFPKRSCGR